MPRGNPSAAAGGCNADEAASDQMVRSRFIFCGQPTCAKPQGLGTASPDFLPSSSSFNMSPSPTEAVNLPFVPVHALYRTLF